MPVAGRSKDVPITDLEYDVENPRIKKWLEFEGEITAERISLALGVGSPSEESDSSGTTFSSLKESIRASGRIIHPIIVNKTDGKMTVIEGNTRLAIYREFDEGGVAGDWASIPSIVYENLAQAEIDAIRLQSHLVGPRQWDPYSKAKYLNHLYNSEHLTVDRIVEYCGGRRSENLTAINAYHDMEKYYRAVIPDDGSFDATRFSGFVELQRPIVKEAILDAGYDIHDFARWIHEHKIENLQLVRQLPKILKDERARDVFIERGVKEALKTLDNPNIDQVLQNSSFRDLCSALTRSIRQIQFEDLMRMKNRPDSDEAMAVSELASEIDLLNRQLESD